MTAHSTHDDSPTPLQRSAMRNAIGCACCSSLPVIAFTNGLILLLLTALDISSERIVIYISLPSLIGALASVPFAILSDHFGKKLMGVIGAVMELLAWIVLSVASLLTVPDEWLVVSILGTYVFSLTLTTSSWLAILSPVVPESMRGRFFAHIRVSWQSVNILFATGCALYLSEQTPIPVFGWVFVLLSLALVLRLFFYIRIPEVEPPDHQPLHIREAVRQIFRAEGFSSFCAYMFLLTLATAGGPILFGLIEKKVLGYGDDLVMWLGNLYMVGALAGFAIGGRMVDRYGTRPVFLIAHFGYAAVLALFVSRVFWPDVVGATFVPVGLANCLYGFMWAFASIAVSTEMLALIPSEHKSLSTSICITFIRIGGALSGLLAAALLKLGALVDNWSFFGATMSRYDTVLMFGSVGVVFLVVTLGLVPSILHKEAQWVPRQY